MTKSQLIKSSATIGDILNKISLGNFVSKIKTNPMMGRRNFTTEAAGETKSAVSSLIKDPPLPTDEVKSAIHNLTGAGVPLLKGTYNRRDFLKRLATSISLDPITREASKTTANLALKSPAHIAEVIG
jgi:hypothetical protein